MDSFILPTKEMVDSKITLRDYLHNYIHPLYNCKLFDAGHNYKHILSVYEKSIIFAGQPELTKYALNMNMVRTIAIYHDIGRAIDKENHGEESANILLADTVIPSFFNPNEIDIMADAIIRHRSSYRGDRGSIYGMILADADKETDPIVFTERLWGFKNHPGSNSITGKGPLDKLSDLEKFGDMIASLDLVFSPGGKMDGYELDLDIQRDTMNNLKKTLYHNPVEVLRILVDVLGVQLKYY